MISRSEIDQSHVELNLRMTEGDPIAFNFLVKDAASWSATSFTSLVRQQADSTLPTLATMIVVVTAQGLDLDVKLTSVPVAALTALNSPFAWAMKEVNGVTRFGGFLYVEPSPV